MGHLDAMVCQVAGMMMRSNSAFSFVCRSEADAKYVFDAATALVSMLTIKMYWEVQV